MADEPVHTSEKDTGSAVTGKEPGETTTERSADEASDARPGNGTSRVRRKPSWRTVLVGTSIALLLASTAVLGSQLYRQHQSDAFRRSAVEAARKYAADLASYDYRKLDDNFTTVTGNSTGQFAEQYEHVSSALTELIEQQQAVSDGSVLSAGIAELDENRAVVLLFVDQKITNVNSPEPRIDRTRMQMTLSRENNHWLIADIKLL